MLGCLIKISEWRHLYEWNSIIIYSIFPHRCKIMQHGSVSDFERQSDLIRFLMCYESKTSYIVFTWGDSFNEIQDSAVFK